VFVIKYSTKVQKFSDMSNYFLMYFNLVTISVGFSFFLINWCISKLVGSL